MCGTVFLLLRCYVGVCVAVFDLCARLQAVVQEVWELYFSGLAACVDWSCRRGPVPLRPRTGENTLEVGRDAGSKALASIVGERS